MLFVLGFFCLLAEPTQPAGILVPILGLGLMALEITRLRKEG